MMKGYINFVDKLASQHRDELFFNSGPIHAAIVMSRIFKYTKNTEVVRIFCGGFSGAVSNDEEYLRYLDDFLQRGGTLKVLAEDDLSSGSGKIFKVLKKHKDKVEIYHTEHRVFLDGENPIHFTIGGETMLRVETGTLDYTAQVNFGNKKEAQDFIETFDSILQKSKSNPIALA